MDNYDLTKKNKSMITFDASADAESPYGDLEITKYLYGTKLQNIFNDYQKNIASLSQNEQQNLQDAYYIRELSKKYLGEYASNAGIGDVSGNLLDIYSKYQQNIGEIKSNYDVLELNLDKEYQKAKSESETVLLANEYQRALRQQEIEASQPLAVTDIKSPYRSDGSVNADYNAELDPTYLFDNENEENISKKSSIYSIEGSNQQYVQVLDDVEHDKKIPYPVTNADLIANWNADEANAGKVLSEGTMYYDRDTASYYVYKNSKWYRTVAMMGVMDIANTNQQNWELKGNASVSSDGLLQRRKNKNNLRVDIYTLTIGGQTYKTGSFLQEDFSNDGKLTAEQQGIIDEFEKIHPHSTNPAVVYYKGKFWLRDENGRFSLMIRK